MVNYLGMSIPKSCAAIFDKAETEIKESVASSHLADFSLNKMKSGIGTLSNLEVSCHKKNDGTCTEACSKRFKEITGLTYGA